MRVYHPVKNRLTYAQQIPHIAFIQYENLIIDLKLYPVDSIQFVGILHSINIVFHLSPTPKIFPKRLFYSHTLSIRYSWWGSQVLREVLPGQILALELPQLQFSKPKPFNV